MFEDINKELTKPFLPKHDNGYSETIRIDLAEHGIKDVVFDIPPKPKLEHEIEMWDTINRFESDSWSPKKLGLKSGYSSVDKAFDGGIRSGFYIIGADSNVGKM